MRTGGDNVRAEFKATQVDWRPTLAGVPCAPLFRDQDVACRRQLSVKPL